MSADLCSLTAAQLAERYRDGSLSPVEATRAALERIERLNPVLNAFCLVDANSALASAAAAEARWRKGEPLGPLDGVPVSVKDVILARGWPTLRGSKTVDPRGTWNDDAPAVARLREAGAVLLGKTTTPEFGWKGVTDSPLTGITRNPWDPKKTPGGSSGGAAAAVASGMGPLALGTDGGGSIRIPSAFTGVFGIKPTHGRVPFWPPSPTGTLAHMGPIARSVTDAARMLAVLALPDARDWAALPRERRDWLATLEDGVSGLRIAYSADLGYARVDPEVARIAAAAVRTFERLGAIVEERDPGFDDPHDVFTRHWFPGAAWIVRSVPPARRRLMDKGLLAVAKLGERFASGHIVDAAVQRAALGARMGEFHERYDLLVTPTMPIPAFDAGREVPPKWKTKRWTDWTPFTYPFNLTQQPAASIPCGRTKAGLPVALQLVGPRFADALVLRAARAFEREHPIGMPDVEKLAAMRPSTRAASQPRSSRPDPSP